MRSRLFRLWLPRVLTILLLALAGFAILRKHVSRAEDGALRVSSDVLAYVSAAENMREGSNIYLRSTGEGNSYVYPPFLAFVFLPLSLLPPLAVDVGWYVLNLLLTVILMRQAYALFTGKSPGALGRGERWLLYFLSILCALRYLVRNAQDANINIVLLALIVAGVYLARSRRNPAWISFLGLAAAVKILPLLFTFYFLARREWKELGYLVGSFVLASMLPIMLLGFPTWLEDMRFFLAYAQGQFAPPGIENENFAVWGFLGRLLSHNQAFPGPGNAPVYINIADLPLGLLKACVYLVNGTIALVFYLAARTEVRWERRTQGAEGAESRSLTAKGLRREGSDSLAQNGTFVLGLLAMNLVSVLIEDHHTVGYLVAFLYLFLVWKTVSPARRRLLTAGLALAGAAGLLLSHDVIVPVFGKTFYNYLLSYSLPVLPVGMLLFGMVLWVFPRHQRFSGSTAVSLR